MALTLADWLPLPTLDIRGPRGALTEARALELAHPVLSGSSTHFERVILSTWAFSEASARVFGDVLRRLPNLRSLVAADIIAGRPEAEGLAVYRALGAALRGVPLQEVDFSDNAMGPKGVAACHDLLSGNPALQRLYFVNCGVSAEAARSIADALLGSSGGDAAATQLRVLHLENNMSGGGGAIAMADLLRASPHMEDFKFASSRGTGEGGAAIAAALGAGGGGRALRRLCLHDNSFGGAAVQALASALREAPRALTHLDIGDVLARDAGLCAVSAALPAACGASLEVLDVSENEAGERGGVGLAYALQGLPALQVLSAQGNEFGEAGGLALARGLVGRAEVRRRRCGGEGADTLRVLNFSDCGMGSSAAVAIARAAISALPGLQKLHLGGNEVSALGKKRIADAVRGAGLAAGTVDLGAVVEVEEGGGGEEEEEEEDLTIKEGWGAGVVEAAVAAAEAAVKSALAAAAAKAAQQLTAAEVGAIEAALLAGAWRV